MNQDLINRILAFMSTPERVRAYYSLKPLIPRRFQIYLRRRYLCWKMQSCHHLWPIDPLAAAPPKDWAGWPEGKRFAFVLTHDVDTERGQGRCGRLMQIDVGKGFRSSFNFVPESYPVSPELRETLFKNGFEIGVHGLYHDGKLYRNRKLFLKRCYLINLYMKEWGCVGFRSPSMHHNLEWLHDLDIEYDASTFDTDPFEPQPKGMRTVFPFHVTNKGGKKGYVELPYTLPQDFTVFILLQEKTIEIWKKKLDWIVEVGGMALLNVHPDYLSFDGPAAREEYPVSYYEEFLEYVRTRYDGLYWHVLPREMARHWANQVNNRGEKPSCPETKKAQAG